jgi:hypothetical protein
LLVLASCELLMLILLLLLTDIDNPFVLFEHLFFQDGIFYIYYEYPDGTVEYIAVRGNDIYSQTFDENGRLVRVEDNWPGDNPNPSNPGFPYQDAVLESLLTAPDYADKAIRQIPRGRSDASRGNPDKSGESEEFEQQESSPPIPSEGSSEGSVPTPG